MPNAWLQAKLGPIANGLLRLQDMHPAQRPNKEGARCQAYL
jgi:hypothetical protein